MLLECSRNVPGKGDSELRRPLGPRRGREDHGEVLREKGDFGDEHVKIEDPQSASSAHLAMSQSALHLEWLADVFHTR